MFHCRGAGETAGPATDRPPSSGDDAIESGGCGRGSGRPFAAAVFRRRCRIIRGIQDVEDDAATHHLGMNLRAMDQGQIGRRSIGRDRNDVPGRGGRMSQRHVGAEVHHHMVAVPIQMIDGVAIRIDHHPSEAGMVARPHGRFGGSCVRTRGSARAGQQDQHCAGRQGARDPHRIIRSWPAACRYPIGPWRAPGAAGRSTDPRRWRHDPRRAAPLRPTSPNVPTMCADLGLDRLQRVDDLGDALPGDVLEAARLIDPRRRGLQLRRRFAADGAATSSSVSQLSRIACVAVRGVLDDRIQLVGGERDVARR